DAADRPAGLPPAPRPPGFEVVHAATVRPHGAPPGHRPTAGATTGSAVPERADGSAPVSDSANSSTSLLRRMVTVEEDADWLRQHPKREQEWLRQLSLIYSGLILIGVYMVQPFLTAASLDLSAELRLGVF